MATKGKSPTSRTLERCRALGWLADRTEHRLPAPPGVTTSDGRPLTWGRTQDLFGFGDVLAIDRRVEPYQLVVIQTTSGDNGNGAGRLRKILDAEHIEAAEGLLRAGVRVEVWAWYQYAEPVERRYWRERIYPVTLELVMEARERHARLALRRARQHSDAAGESYF